MIIRTNFNITKTRIQYNSMSDRVKNTSYSLFSFITLLQEKGWLTKDDIQNKLSKYQIEEDEDLGNCLLFYFIFLKDSEKIFHLVYGNKTYAEILEDCNTFNRDGILYTLFVSTLSSNPKINQIDITQGRYFPDIPNHTHFSTIK